MRTKLSGRLKDLNHPWIRRILWATAGLAAVGLLTLAVAWSVMSRDVDAYLALFSVRVPPTTTKIFDVKGIVIGVLADQHREIVPYGDIPAPFIAAVIATEDTDFYSHGGVSMRGLARAGWNMVKSLGTNRQGGSTITMQLVRAVTNKRQIRLGRKLKEMILARKLEKAFTKQQILTNYTNEVWFGRQFYGLQAAARYYFDKNAINLNIEECATLAGMIQSPGNYNPYLGPRARQLCTQRRNHVLRRMVDTGYLGRTQAETLIARPIRLAKEGGSTDNLAPYAVEMVKNYLFSKFGAGKVMEGGFEVHTTIDSEWQDAANTAVRNGLRAVDRQRGVYRKAGVWFPKEDPDKVQLPQWKRLFGPEDTVRGIILGWQSGRARVRIGATILEVPESAFAWAGKDALKILTRGAMPLFIVKAVDANGLPTQLELDQEPDVEAALMAIDPTNGEIRAMVGGYDFKRSQFDHSWQAYRQVGSTMKAFVYGTAFSQGKSPASIVEDVPTTIHFAEQLPYAPKNYERDYFGPITMYEAIRDSRNVAAVRTLDEVGGEAFVDFAKKCGIENRLDPYPASALGTADLTLQEMVRAYGTLANMGRQAPRPFLITRIVDRTGKVLERHGQTIGEQVVDPVAVYQLIQCLRGAIQTGTGTRANVEGWDLAGKTGTTQDHTDAWFLGFSTRVTCGVWVGLDAKKTIYKKADGGKVAAPIWGEFMKKILPSTPQESFQPPETPLEWADIDNYTGLRVVGKAQDRVLKLAFRPGTVPKGESDAAAIARIQEGRARAAAGTWPMEVRTWGQVRSNPVEGPRSEEPPRTK
jgi:penicillin-binding protein 1A